MPVFSDEPFMGRIFQQFDFSDKSFFKDAMSRLTLEKNLNSYCFATLILSKTCKYGIKTHGSFINSVFILFAMVHNTTLTGALNTQVCLLTL